MGLQSTSIERAKIKGASSCILSRLGIAAHVVPCSSHPVLVRATSLTQLAPSMASKDDLGTKRRRLERSCMAVASCPKVALARILMTLHSEGCLVDGLIDDGEDEDTIRKHIASSAAQLGEEQTPFGTVVQTMMLNISPPFKWTFIHPLALVYMLSTRSRRFSELMKRTIDQFGTLSIVLFVDEIRPGNILRPDQGRATQNLFWCFAELPEWYLVREDAWFIFGGIRSSIVGKIEGDMSTLMVQVLHAFWSPSGPNFETTGGMIVCGSDHIIFKARFAGFLGDEKGLKEVFASKGPASTRPCLSCKNVVQFMDNLLTDDDYLVSVKTANPARFDRATDADIFALADRLRHDVGILSKGAFESLEQSMGLHFVPSGVLYDEHCRSLVRPVTGWFRDWMHVMAVQGVANIEIEQVVHQLRHENVRPSMITDFFDQIRLPKAAAKVDKDWFTYKRLGRPSAEKDGWKGFSSEILTIVPILLFFFLEKAVKPTGCMLKHIECFKLLDKLLKLFSLGSDTSPKHMCLIKRTIAEHAALFEELYPDVRKPKYHHLFHVVDHMENLGRLLSCFVTERKHRAVKHVANHLFRHFETALVTDMLNLMVDRFTNRQGMFVPEHLVKPSPMGEHASMMLSSVGVTGVCTSSFTAHLVCGKVCKGDLIVTVDRSVGSVLVFFAVGDGIDADISCIMQPYMHEGANRYRPALAQPIVVRSRDIAEPVMYCEDGDSVCVLPPMVSATW